MAKRKGNKPVFENKKQQDAPSPEEQAKKKKERVNVSRHSLFIALIVAVAMVAIFVGRWSWSVMNGYFAAFVDVDETAETAMGNARGLEDLSDASGDAMALLQDWDDFTSSRLCNELTITSSFDGASLHGYLYDNGSDTTVVFLPRFYEDGTADFLAGSYLYDLTECNIFIPDARCIGESEGEYFSWGYNEKYDVADWLGALNEQLGMQSFLLYGEGVGANTILFAQSAYLLSDYDVKGVILESPYTSIKSLAKTNLYKWYTLPSFPFLNVILWKTNHTDIGFSVSDTDLTNVLSGYSSDIPVLFLYSDGDKYIPSKYSLELYNLYAGTKEAIVSDGSHGSVVVEKQSEIESWVKSVL